MFWTRLISGIVLVAVLLGTIIPGDWILFAFTLFISLIGLFELFRVFGFEKKAIGFIGYLAIVVYYLNLRFAVIADWRTLMMALIVVLFFGYVLTYPKYHATQIAECVFGVFYVGVMLSYIYCTRMFITDGKYLVWLIFLGSWGCDTCAYCVGVLFGKHKLAPVLSPKKSIEGSIGGVLGSALLGVLYAIFLQTGFTSDKNVIWIVALICGISAIFSQFGDLAASAIKRNYEIKDYGHLIPGHGGIMDRFDSVIVTAPLIYYLCYYLY